MGYPTLEYRSVFKNPFVFSVSGLKNSGKTMLINKLIPLFKADGFKIAILKHDGHDFNIYHKNTDNYRFFNSGADSVTIYSNNKQATILRKSFELDSYLKIFKDSDFVIIEDHKYNDQPKIKVIRDQSLTTTCLYNQFAVICDHDIITTTTTFSFDAELEIYQHILKKQHARSI